MTKKTFSLGHTWLILLLTFLGAFTPLSIDMYLPALPHMAESLETSYSYVSLSISGFMLLFALGMLFWGPFSDKYGRKPTLLIGSLLYITASIAIALSPNIIWLLTFRAIQAISSSALASMSLAIARDLLRGKALERVLSIMQMLMVIMPMVAPNIGGAILLVTNWRGIFWCLAAFGLLGLAGSVHLNETCKQKSQTTLFKTIGRIVVVLENKAFRQKLLLFSVLTMPFMAYLGVSSTIYQDMFGLSPQAFSLFFAGNACMSMLAPFVHLKVFIDYPKEKVITLHLTLMALGATLLLLNQTLIGFALCYALITFAGSALRPPTTILMLETVKGDTGVVTSLINCAALLCASLSMIIAVLPWWKNPIYAAGTISLTISVTVLLIWLKLSRKAASKE